MNVMNNDGTTILSIDQYLKGGSRLTENLTRKSKNKYCIYIQELSNQVRSDKTF